MSLGSPVLPSAAPDSLPLCPQNGIPPGPPSPQGQGDQEADLVPVLQLLPALLKLSPQGEAPGRAALLQLLPQLLQLSPLPTDTQRSV